MNINRGMTLIIFITLLYILCLETNISGMLQKHYLMFFLFKFTCPSITLGLSFDKRGSFIKEVLNYYLCDYGFNYWLALLFG